VTSATVTVDLGALSALRATWRLSTKTVTGAPNTALSVPPGAITITVGVEATAPTWAIRGTVAVPIVALAGANITLRLTDALAPFFIRTELDSSGSPDPYQLVSFHQNRKK
jgi:hypothetical protein